jgi:hypothetical protein
LKHDVLHHFNDQLLVNEPQLQTLVRQAGIGSEVTLKILRKGREETVVVKLGEHDELAAGPSSLAREYGIHRPGGFGYGQPPGDLKLFHGPLNGQGFADQMRELSERIKNLEGKPDQIRKEIERFQKELQEYSNDRRTGRDSKADAPHNEMRRRSGDTAASAGSARVWKDDKGGIRVEVSTNSDDGKGTPGAEPSVTATADGEGKVIVTQNSSTRMAWNDTDGSGELVIENGKKRAKVKGPDGKEIFSGPVDTEEQLKALPPKVRERLEGMEQTLKVTPRPAGKPAGEL